jgi:carbon monoxide dehydrogenase subunit G
MELEHSFSVPVPVERAWDVLLDVERVAPCMPGATLDSVSGDEIAGRIKVRVGPISMTYAGTAKFTERDKAAGVVTLEAAGKETRGAGTASASVRSQLKADGDQTDVTVHTTLTVTGKPAQFGRGVLTEVGGKLIGIFADNLAAMLAAEPAADPTPGDGAAHSDRNAVGQDDGTSDEALPIDVLNLSSRAWSSLRRDGIQTLGDLTRRTEQQLRAIENIGPASIADIRTKLADRGLALADSADGSSIGSQAAKKAQANRHGKVEPSAAGPPPTEQNGDRPAAGKHAAATGDLAEVTQLRPARHESDRPQAGQDAAAQREPAAWQPPDDDAIDLLGVAGMPVLKRAIPAAVGLVALILVLFGIRRRRRRS